MFSFSEEGLVHQASYAFAVNLNDFTKVYHEKSYEIPYASHSFHQYILNEGDSFVYVDRCDALPYRSFHLTRMTGGSAWNIVGTGDSFIFKGEYADNLTYSQLGGIVRTDKGYMLCGTYENVLETTDDCSANLFVQRFDRNLNAGQVTYHTDFKDTLTDIDSVISPKIMSVSDYQAVILYMVANTSTGFKELRVAGVDSDAELLSDNQVSLSEETLLPRLGQVLYNPVTKSANWFSIKDSKLVMSCVELDDIIVPEPVTQTTTQPATEPPEETTAPTTEPTTAPEPVTQPQQPCIFQQIIDFFVGIYNWFVDLILSIFN